MLKHQSNLRPLAYDVHALLNENSQETNQGVKYNVICLHKYTGGEFDEMCHSPTTGTHDLSGGFTSKGRPNMIVVREPLTLTPTEYKL